jgi:hypothetical protein
MQLKVKRIQQFIRDVMTVMLMYLIDDDSVVTDHTSDQESTVQDDQS